MEIFLIIMLVIIVFCIYMAVMTSKVRKQAREKDRTDGGLGSYSLKHIQGLEIPEGPCSVRLFSDKVVMSGAGKEYTLALAKISDVSFDMNVDVERYTKASKVAGVAGALTFGVPGAIIASAPKTKVERRVTNVVSIAFLSAENEVRYILFQNIVPNDLQAARFVDKLRPLIQTKPQSVEL